MSITQLTATPGARTRAKAQPARTAGTLPDTLWTPADRVVTPLVIGTGGTLTLIAWLGASDTTDWESQLSWTALSMAGVVVVCVGVGNWLFRGFARVRSEAREVRRLLGARLAHSAATTGDDNPSGGTRVTVAGMRHHHAPGCLLVAGKATAAANETAALTPCGVCA